LSVVDIQGILKSLQSVFPHVEVWYANSEPHENTIVIASKSPFLINPGVLGGRLAEPRVADDLAAVGITSVNQLLDFFMLGDRAVADFARPGKLNTDDHPRLEFLAPQTLQRKQSWIDNFASLRLAREPIEPYLIGAGEPQRAELARRYAGTTWKLAGQSYELEGRVADVLAAYAEGVRVNSHDVIAQIRLGRLRKALGAGTAKPRR
jgi:hypothetical protein